MTKTVLKAGRVMVTKVKRVNVYNDGFLYQFASHLDVKRKGVVT